ncbi:SirB1 family protein [Singulisphaera sp. PoT]|uniref:SirB1 family protein n=1 Tax=Singulisphaera sp. PoT TaxID=3411797 RepID=UPI003BF50A74
MRLPFSTSPEFRKLLTREEPTDLMRIALEIAQDAYPHLDTEDYLGKVDALTTRIRERCPANSKPRGVLGQINWVLFVEEGYRGNGEDYYDPRNSYLNEVLDRKLGIPISLSALYWTLAGRLGLAMSGVSLPAHFLLKVGEDDSTLFVDPYHGGAILDQRGCEMRVSEIVGEPVRLTEAQLASCDHATVAARMLRNLKAIYLRNQDFFLALPVMRRLAALRVDDHEEQRDLGLLCLQLERPAEAIVPLQAYLDASPKAEDVDQVRTLLSVARREVATWN